MNSPADFLANQAAPLQASLRGRRLYLSGQIDDGLMDAFGLEPERKTGMYYRDGEWRMGERQNWNAPIFRLSEIDEIVLNSIGGMLYPALAVANLLKSYKVNVTLLPGTECHSSCTWIFLTGTHRRMLGDANLMFHPIHDREGCWERYSEYLEANDRSHEQLRSCREILGAMHVAQLAIDSLIDWLYTNERIAKPPATNLFRATGSAC